MSEDSKTFCRHPYKYDGSDDSDSETERSRSKSSRRSKSRSGRSSSRSSRSGRSSSRKEEKKKNTETDAEPEQPEEPKEPEEPKRREFTETDVESDGEDNSCVKMSIHFVNKLTRTIEKEDVHALRDTLRKTPIAVVLHYLHYLFHLVRDMPDFYRVIDEYNDKYNIVSKYFLKALRSEERTRDVMNSLQKVTSGISSRVPLNEIEDLLHFTPEFIVMATIQSGNLASHDKIISEWEITPKFMRVRDLIAAFFGIKRYFSDPERYADRRDLIISCICGGSTKTLARVMRKTKSEYLTEYTIHKTRAICIPNKEMVEYLQLKYDLTFC